MVVWAGGDNTEAAAAGFLLAVGDTSLGACGRLLPALGSELSNGSSSTSRLSPSSKLEEQKTGWATGEDNSAGTGRERGFWVVLTEESNDFGANLLAEAAVF